MSKDPIKVGFVGLSSQPAWSWSVAAHLPYFVTTSNYKIVALQNYSTETAKKAARLHNLGEDVAAYGDIQSTVSDPNIDLVAVCLKVPAHLPIIEAALKAGKAVFSEWLLARNVAEAEYLANLAAEKAARTLVGLQGRHDPSVLKARDMVAGGELGDILQTTMLFTSPWFGATFPADAAGNIQGFQPTVSFVKAETGSKLEKIEVEEAKDFSFNTGRAWNAFAGEGEGAVPDFQDALLRHRMLEAIYRSNQKGTREEYM